MNPGLQGLKGMVRDRVCDSDRDQSSVSTFAQGVQSPGRASQEQDREDVRALLTERQPSNFVQCHPRQESRDRAWPAPRGIGTSSAVDDEQARLRCWRMLRDCGDSDIHDPARA